MPRPCKRRRICAAPSCGCFGPKGDGGERQPEVIMTLDEYESIRLIDFLGLTQEQSAERMDVARTTVQAIYAGAREKLAECLILGKELQIKGGDYVLCDGGAAGGDAPCCGVREGDIPCRCGEGKGAPHGSCRRRAGENRKKKAQNTRGNEEKNE